MGAVGAGALILAGCSLSSSSSSAASSGSNLDADLRERMRVQISSLVREAAATTIYITHDQAEAFALADRAGVLQQGSLIQAGPRRRSTPVRRRRSWPGSPGSPASCRSASASRARCGNGEPEPTVIGPAGQALGSEP